MERFTIGQPSQEYTGKNVILTVIAILLLTIVVFSSSFQNRFVNLDDDKNVYENIYIRDINAANLKIYFTKPLLSMYTPLVYLSYALDYQIGGLNPRVYHLTNLLLHLACITLVFFVFYSLTGKLDIAAVASVLFAVHPMNVAAVTPVSVRSSLLYSAFYLGACLCYIHYLRGKLNVRFLLAVFVFFTLSLLSKSAAVVFPLLMALIDWRLGRKWDRRAIAEKIPFVLLSIIFGIITVIFRKGQGDWGSIYKFTAFERILLISYSLLFYVFKLLIPVNLSAYYPYPERTLEGYLPIEFYLAPVVIILIAYALFKAKKYKRELIFGVVFFFVHLLLVLRVTPLGWEIVSDRYDYIPSLGPFFLIGYAYSLSSEGTHRLSCLIKRGFTVLLILCTGVFSAISFQRNTVWKDNLALYGNIIQRNQHFPLAYNNRGTAEAELKDYESAMRDFNKAVELNPFYADAYLNRGSVEMALKNYEGALRDYTKATELNPSDADAHYNRANVKKELKDYEGAMRDFNRVLELNPYHAHAYFNRGLLKMMYDKDSACDDLRKSFALGYSQTDIRALLRNYCNSVETRRQRR